MQSLAQVLRNEGKEIWMNEGKKQTIKEVAMSMLNDNFSIEAIMKHTCLTEQEIRGLMS